MRAVVKRKIPSGWMAKAECRWLAAQARTHTRIIEVGAWMGRSTTVLSGATSGIVWAVDHWQGTPTDADQHAKLYAAKLDQVDVYGTFRHNMRHQIQRKKVRVVRLGSVEAAAMLFAKYGAAFDFVFIDADHSYEGCRADIAAYLPLLKPGGLLAGHDYHWPGVKQAVDERLGAVSLGPNTLWSVRVTS
jgi:predicted O-methyltransferase YrrM